jgi:hypothetical protein
LNDTVDNSVPGEDKINYGNEIIDTFRQLKKSR